MPYEVHDLIGDRPEPVRVLREDSLAAALAKMVAHDYSQLPVVAGDEDKTPVGLVTSDSILRALDNFGVTTRQLRVRDALIPPSRLRFRAMPTSLRCCRTYRRVARC